MPGNSAQDLTVAPVQGKKDLAEFISLPWRIQASDPCWTPPVISEQEKVLDPRKGPFFEFGEAQLFLASYQGRTAGRISAHVNRRYEERHDKETGFFGFFECIDNPAVAHALFEAAAAWLKARQKSRIQGPLSFTIYDELGLLVEGFDTLPAFLQVHNPPYYQDLVTSWGFRKAVDWYALRVMRNGIIGIDKMGGAIQQIMDGAGLTLTSFDGRELIRRAEEVLEIFNEAWDDNWGHVPLTRKQFIDVFKQLRPLMRRELIKLVMDGERIVAFILNIPDLNPSIQKLNGRLSLLSQLKLLYEARFKPVRKIRTLIMGVRKPYQRRRLHHALIMSSILEVGTRPGFEMCDCSLISEPLVLLIRQIERYGGERYKTFRIFEREI